MGKGREGKKKRRERCNAELVGGPSGGRATGRVGQGNNGRGTGGGNQSAVGDNVLSGTKNGKKGRRERL
jgi:hypothetical protein